MTRIDVIDVTGKRWIGDSFEEEIEPSGLEALHDLLSDFKDLNYLSLEIEGAKHYFNPVHIVAVSIHAEG